MATSVQLGEPNWAGAARIGLDDQGPPTISSKASGLPGVELNGNFLGGYEAPDQRARVRLQATHAMDPSPESLESILDESSSFLPFHFLRTGDRLGRAVVKLLRGDGAAGTGFLVAPGILLTNHHVLPDPTAAALAVALANFEAGPSGDALKPPASVPLAPESLFVTNAQLDFTFCGVRGLDYLGSIALDRNSGKIAAREGVNIIQHPRGRPKEVALRDNRVVKVDNVVIHYECSTEPGSSGSPVFNNRWEPVALHHASVRSDVADASSIDGDLAGEPTSRYLNEGIRISAIAIWLETAEANSPDLRDQAARLRSLIGGIDPRVGFFGGLGRKALGRSAPEVVSDRGDTDDLDLAYWNIRGLELGSRDRLVEVARVVAEMGIDLWCLAHTDREYVDNLREHLASYFGLDYDCHLEPAGAYPPLAFLHRRCKAVALERSAWGIDLPDGVALPPLLTLRASTRRTGAVAFRIVAVGRATTPGGGVAPYAEAIRHAIRRGHGEFDWLIVGDGATLLAPERLQVLADSDRALIAAASERDGAVALLAGPRSKVARMFVSPNLMPAYGLPEALTVARDRDLPAIFTTLGGCQPIALRLALDPDARPATIAVAATQIGMLDPFDAIEPPEPPNPLDPVASTDVATPPDHDDLERRLRDMIAPVLAKLLAEARTPPE